MSDKMYDLVIDVVLEARHNWQVAQAKNIGHRTFDEKAQELEKASDEAWNRYQGMIELAHRLGVAGV